MLFFLGMNKQYQVMPVIT